MKLCIQTPVPPEKNSQTKTPSKRQQSQENTYCDVIYIKYKIRQNHVLDSVISSYPGGLQKEARRTSWGTGHVLFLSWVLVARCVQFMRFNQAVRLLLVHFSVHVSYLKTVIFEKREVDLYILRWILALVSKMYHWVEKARQSSMYSYYRKQYRRTLKS
jgi:hypothetical protein